jgi:4-amino-4-deoxy-L-arabinose transferase-like glycosyltransferase
VSYSLPSDSAATGTIDVEAWRRRAGEAATVVRRGRLDLVGLMALTGLLNLWALSRNGWANDYYSAAVRSMSTSWHDFLFASLDRAGVMTVDKPPLALWVQALSVRLFGYHPLSVLVPQALMGMATVALVYDLVRRRFGRLGGFVAGLVLALTPITVAISRHNNPDALLVLCCVAALWFAARGLEDGRLRWLVGAGVCAGLAFETKMLVAMVIVPGIAAAWLWSAPGASPLARMGGRLRAVRQLLIGGLAMVLVGGAWPALVELTPASQRPWISGTSDNTVLSLIFEYNGVGRVDGQAGGPGGVGGNQFGGSTGPLRLLNAALGGQAGWLLGFALVAGLAILASSRLRRDDRRSGWLLLVGGAFLVTAVLFSFASGIFHPYYVSLLAPFAAALVGAGVAELVAGRVEVRIFGPLAVAGGVASELIVLGDYRQQLTWLAPVLIAAGVLAVAALAVSSSGAMRTVAVLGTLAVLLLAPATWAFDTLGHATNGTFPEGGPADVQSVSSSFGGRGPGGAFGRSGFGRGGGQQLFGTGGSKAAEASEGVVHFGGGAAPGGEAPGAGGGAPGAGGPGGQGGGFAGPGGGFGGAPGAGQGAFGSSAGMFGSQISSAVLSYLKAHGGGTIAVSSQSSAAGSIIEQDAEVAGIGGFSGRESDVSVSWLAQEVAKGKIRWVLDESGGGGVPADGRKGSKAAMAAAAQACRRVTLGEGESVSTSDGFGGGSGTLYDCSGRAAAMARLGAQESKT